MREILFAGRTVAVYNSLLIGKAEFLTPLLAASIKVNSAEYIDKTQVLGVELENVSSSPFLFENNMDYSFYSNSPVLEISVLGKYTLRIKTLEEMESMDLKLKAIGAFTAPKESPVTTWTISVE